MSTKQPDVTYFIDRSLGRHKVADALRATGRKVIVHDEEFAPATKDEEWLSAAGKAGWIVLTKDDHIRYRANERSAVERAEVRLFVLTAKNLTGDEMADILVLAAPRMERAIAGKDGHLIARVDRAGRVTEID